MTTVTLPQILEAHRLTTERISDGLASQQFDASWVEEIPCQGDHTVSTCSIEVTHRLTWCAGSGLICDNMAKVKMNQIKKNAKFCRDCGNWLGTCWRVRPWG